jgi:hypothetical protein
LGPLQSTPQFESKEWHLQTDLNSNDRTFVMYGLALLLHDLVNDHSPQDWPKLPNFGPTALDIRSNRCTLVRIDTFGKGFTVHGSCILLAIALQR